MKVELHLHTSRYSGCAVNTPTEMMQRLIETGYGAVYLTEHDAVWPYDRLADLQATFPEIKTFSGVELSITSHHLLVLGTNDPSYLDMYDEADVLARAADEGHLTILAHPFRWESGAEMLDKPLLPDAIEFRTPNHDFREAEISAATAEQLGLALVNAGDSHSVQMIDKFWIETASPIEQADDIRRIILSDAYKNCIREE